MLPTKAYTLLLTIATASILLPIHAAEEKKQQKPNTFQKELTLAIANEFQDKDEEKQALLAQFQGDNKTIKCTFQNPDHNDDDTITIPKDILNEVATDLSIVLTLGGKSKNQIKITTANWLKLINGAFQKQNINVKASSIINFDDGTTFSNTHQTVKGNLDKGTYGIQVSTKGSASKDDTITNTPINTPTNTLTNKLTNTQKFFIVLAIISVLGGLYYFLGRTSKEDKAQDTKAKRTPRSKEVPASA